MCYNNLTLMNYLEPVLFLWFFLLLSKQVPVERRKNQKVPNMNRFACTIVALSLVPLVTSECVVNTIESNETCVFPFTIFTDNKDGNGSAENNTYFECTTDHDPDKRPWCATKVDSNGVFLKKQWDYCDLESQSCNDDGTELRSVDFFGKIT